MAAESGLSGDSAAASAPHSAPRKDEIDFCRRVADGDHAAFRVLVERYQDRVFGFCARMLGDRAEAEDVAQDVFVTVFRNAHAFRGEASFATWIFRIARNQTINRIKYLERRGRSWRRAILRDPAGASTEEAAQRDAMDLLVTEERSQIVQQAIATLGPEQREVLVLRDLEDLSYDAISEVTGLPIGTVKSRIHRARSALAKRLEGVLG